MVSERRRTYLLVGVAFVVFVALVFGPARMALNNTPTWQDEVFYAEPARELAQHGVLRAPIFGDVRGLSEVFALQPPITFIERAAVFKVFGFGKRQVRLASVGEYAVCIALLFFAIFRSTEGSRLGVLWAGAGALLFATDNDVVRATTSGRPDMLGVALGLCALGCGVEATRRETRAPWLVGLGAFAALSGSSHPVMLALSPGAGLVCLLCMPASERARASGWFALGWLLGMAPWIGHILLHPDAWKTQFHDHFRGAYAGGSAQVGERTFPLQNLLRHLLDIGSSPYVTLAMPTGLVLSAFYARGARAVPLLFALSAFVGLMPGETFVKVMVASIYAGGTIGWASAITSLKSAHRLVPWALVVLLLVGPVTRHVRLISRRLVNGSYSSEQPIADLIARHIPVHAAVVSQPISYFALKAHGAEQLYPNCLQDLRYARSEQDCAAHNAYLLRRRPGFLLLDDGMPPESVGELSQHATFTYLGTAKNPPGPGLTPRDKYELRLYRVDYAPPAPQSASH